ncbi:DNA repair protein RecN [Maridesulfovibrio hydrothermalis]|uniref:DNA repair protein RecN n=1 Tax=Maridesulfovibrio hydrothermalis AM13 = DSM 14728 TaxID=1121451 RepID=L0R815_9BACT|nr:AAA family ATPase [Maridesulfovibrio hydrothermalis]CCO22340.1 SMC domain protein [Maridesulfovibrio hydrothermalis AM13 = DSM 14728]
MLELLRIRDLALIEDAEIEFSPGMNVLTGETGAGKSFILRAIDFLTGHKMRPDMVRPGKKQAFVEALFINPDGEESIVRRVLSAETGRSRVYVNDKLSSQNIIRDMGASMILHTSQHAQQKLLQPAYQCVVLDTFLQDTSLPLSKDKILNSLRELLSKKAALQDRSASLLEKKDFLEFQRTEIEKVSPYPGEEDELLKKKTALRQQEEAGQCIQNAMDIMRGVPDLNGGVSALGSEMEKVCELFPEYEKDRETVVEFKHFLDELAGKLRAQPLDFDSEESIDDIEERLYELSKLKRKLGRTLDQIVDMQKEIEDNLNFLDSCAIELAQLERKEKELVEQLAAALEKLYEARKIAAKKLTARIVFELKGLGFSEHVQVKFEFQPHELYPGLDEMRGRLMWIPNPGQSAQPLDKIASGGELSRFLLAIAGLQGEADKPTLIFDEVDSGIGGHTLNRVGDKMQELAARQQLVVITHWPQLARLADRHFLIHKGVVNKETFTTCRQLGAAEVKKELSRMAGVE